MPRRTWISLTVLLISCTQPEQNPTATIAPADPRPGPTTTTMLPSAPALATAGSPLPAGHAVATREAVILHDGRIDIRPLLPRGHRVFLVRNAGTREHRIAIAGGDHRIEMPGPLLPGAGTNLQGILRQPVYEVRCLVDGHRERAGFTTYRPR